jgi:hypothetical protein
MRGKPSFLTFPIQSACPLLEKIIRDGARAENGADEPFQLQIEFMMTWSEPISRICDCRRGQHETAMIVRIIGFIERFMGKMN